jgi:hypothetical protein
MYPSFEACQQEQVSLPDDRDSPVNDIEAVQMLQGAQELGRIKPAPQLVKLALPLQVVEQLATVDERQDQVQLFGRLERKLEGHDERIVDLGEDGPFGESVGDFRPGDDVRFPDRLQGVDSQRVSFTNLHDLVFGIRGR